jgi:hypothetical protein
MIRSDDGPGQFLEEVIFFVRALGRSQKSDFVGPILFFDFLETGSDRVEGLIPGGFVELSIFFDQGLRQPFAILDEFVDIPTLDTKPSLADRVCLARLGTHKLAVQGLQIKSAATPAITARR